MAIFHDVENWKTHSQFLIVIRSVINAFYCLMSIASCTESMQFHAYKHSPAHKYFYRLILSLFLRLPRNLLTFLVKAGVFEKLL